MTNTLNIYRNTREIEVTYTTKNGYEVNLTVWHVDEGTSWILAYGAVWDMTKEEPTCLYDVLTNSVRYSSPYRAFMDGLFSLRRQASKHTNTDVYNLLCDLREQLREELR